MSALRVLVALAALLLPAAAEAFVVRVAYYPGNEPTGVTVAQMERVINQNLREWEQHSHGRIIARYDGLIGDDTLHASDLLVVKWKSTVPSDLCARACRFSQLGTCAPGQWPGHVWISTTVSTWTATGFATNGRCMSIHAALMHEFGHIFFDAAGHWPNTIMSQTDVAFDISLRHLWSVDDGNFVNNGYFPLRTRGVRFEEFDPGYRETITTETNYANTYGPATPVALTAGDGEQTQHNYALAWGGFGDGVEGQAGIAVRRGDVGQWQTTFLPRGTSGALAERSTPRRPCIAVSDRGIDFYVVWASENQQPEGTTSPTRVGEHAVFAMESHDRGATWSDPAQIGGAFTRNGISCSVDRWHEEVVAAYQGSGEDGLWITHRPADSSTLGQWSFPTQVTGGGFMGSSPLTAGVPYVAFDRFSTSSGGWLTWEEDATLETVVAPLAWNGTKYEVNAAPSVRNTGLGWTFSARNQLRSFPVLQYESFDLLFVGTAVNYNTQRTFQQWQMYASGGTSVALLDSTFGPGEAFRFSGAASNLHFYRYGMAGVAIQNP